MITVIHEHYNGFDYKRVLDFKGELPFDQDYFCNYTFSKKKEVVECFRIHTDIDQKVHAVSNSYFIGVDWIIEGRHAIYVEPKLNKTASETNYLKMLFAALKHPDIATHTEDLFEIKWEKPQILIQQQQDLLTPLLVVQFLKIVQHIVRKGLKKSYYRVEHNLHGKIKGKINVALTVKHNALKNKLLSTYCVFDEFGENGLENRLLKKALVFVQRYLPTLKNLNAEGYTKNVFNYINPAFESVTEEVSLHEVKHTKTNVFYKEYKEAIQLAKFILKRFGYNIKNVNNADTISTPPFWIDMSKLFELYVLGQLKEKYGNEILYGNKEAKGKYGLPDFLLIKTGAKTIIDSKYKPIYQDNKYDIENIRQLSGYGRDMEVLNKLGFTSPTAQLNTVVKCLIIYPDQKAKEILWDNAEVPIEGFVEFYKRAIKLPEI